MMGTALGWSWANIPILSPILLVILASIILILIYLNKTSKLMSKKKLSWILIATVILFVIINALIFLKNQPPKVKFRLTLFPIQTDSTLTASSWMGSALGAMVTQQLRFSATEQGIVSPVEWIQPIINRDSLTNQNYLKKFTRQMRGDYFLIGIISGDASAPLLRYNMVNALNGATAVNDSVILIPEELPQLSTQISNQILAYFQLPPKKSASKIAYIHPQAYQDYLVGETFYQQKNYPTAIDWAEKALEIDSSLTDAYLLAGKSYFMKGLSQKQQGESPDAEFEPARQLFLKVITLDSTRDDAYAFLGEYSVYRERWSVAEDMLAKAYRLNPNNPRLYLTFSRLHRSRYQQLGLKDEEELFKRAIFIHPGYEDAYLMLADHHLFKNRREPAIQVLEQFLQINPNSVPELMALGKIYLVRNDILKIIAVFNRVLQLEPDNADAYYNLGILYYNSKDFDTAEKFFMRALSINNHANTHLYLAYLYEARGEYEKAIDYLRKRIRLRKGPDDEFAEEARKHLFQLVHRDSTQIDSSGKM